MITVTNADRVIATYPAFFLAVSEGHIAAATQIAELDSKVFLIVVQPYALPLHDMPVADKVNGHPLVVFISFAADFDGSSTISLNFQHSVVVVAAIAVVVSPIVVVAAVVSPVVVVAAVIVSVAPAAVVVPLRMVR
ncbi:hypothetical protein [Arthrobacter crystallopoietes]|uniref:hypothetical protein n=1 Tax=Crystallibacter crystallopoietes TaxID=37928 RepID=UPI001ABE2298|nr:hypothetical protein [Arthrobacter crystallopoietes]QTG81459.1 hypothetical protein J5251_02225 [Arthrobacter crystallopoietes]